MAQDAAVDANLPAGFVAGETRINFRAHEVRAGEHGAREDFEQMVGQLVEAVTPGFARMVAARPGDWGIDVFVGNLGDAIAVWQSKYFMPAVTEAHQSQIRESLASVVKNAAEQGFELTQWTLCVPSSMDAPTTRWWDKWKKKQESLHHIIIELWEENRLRSLLISPDAANVRRHYYEPVSAAQAQAKSAAAVLDVNEVDSHRMESALFVRQLRAAGHVEVDNSKQQFFNAELMAREIIDKGVTAEVAALSTASAAVHGLWEEHFNDACETHESVRLPGLHKSVMGEIRAQHSTLVEGLPGSAVHTCGLMHRVVDQRRAGWVRDWRQVAAEHLQADALDTPGFIKPSSGEAE